MKSEYFIISRFKDGGRSFKHGSCNSCLLLTTILRADKIILHMFYPFKKKVYYVK